MPTDAQKSSSSISSSSSSSSSRSSSSSSESVSSGSPSTNSMSSSGSSSSSALAAARISASATDTRSASTSGLVITSSMASTTSSQRLSMSVPMRPHSSSPSRPWKLRVPVVTAPRMGLPLKNLVIGVSSQTSPMIRTISSTSSSLAMTSGVGSSEASSGTAIRSKDLSSAGSSSSALSPTTVFHAGCSTRSLSSPERMKATSSATDAKPYRSSSRPRNASHSSSPSRQRGAHRVNALPSVIPSSIGTMSPAMATEPSHRS